MAVNTSLKPFRAGDFGEPQARHLLNRAAFGGDRRQVLAVADMGLKRAVEHLVNYGDIDVSDAPTPRVDADLIMPPTPQQRKMMRRARGESDPKMKEQARMMRQERRQSDRQQHQELRRWWLAHMVSTPRPLEEKLTLLWHGHFATNYRTVRDSFLMFQQNVLLRRQACGSFADLAVGIIHDPAMIRFLDNHNNRKQKPNENLARELMELFTLGEGNYTEQDIKQGARALTGYTFRDNDFHFAKNMHDPGPKTILGQRGRFDGDDFVRILLRHKACPQFIGYKLYKHFVADVEYEHVSAAPSARRAIEQLARLLVRHEYQIKPVLKALFTSQHFYDASIVGNKIKSPSQLVVGTMRMLNLPVRDLDTMIDGMRLMGQALFDPPSVAGWDGGRSWISTSTLFVRQNLCAYMISGKRPDGRGWRRSDVDYDPMPLLEGAAGTGPEAVVDHLMSSLLADSVPAQRRQQLLSFLEQRSGPIRPDTVIALLLLITAMPEYQLC